MVDCAELEITLMRQGTEYELSYRFNQPGSNFAPNPDKRITVSINFENLRASQLDPDEYGKRLAGMLFPDRITRYEFHHERENVKKFPLRLRLYIDPNATELHALAWETLVDPIALDRLAASEKVYFSRYLPATNNQTLFLPEVSRLRTLAVIANPNNLNEQAFPPIDVAQHRELVSRALQGLEVTFLDSGGKATLDNLLEELRSADSGERRCDILYLVGHGYINRQDGTPTILLEKQDGSLSSVPISRITGMVLGLSQMPLLAVLVSCKSAAGSEDPLMALGPRLIDCGIPAVIAMNGNVSYEAMQQFLPKLLKELRRDGIIDRAVSAARMNMSVSVSSEEWWKPVLFSRLRDNHIFKAVGEKKPNALFSRRSAIIAVAIIILFAVIFLFMNLSGTFNPRPTQQAQIIPTAVEASAIAQPTLTQAIPPLPTGTKTPTIKKSPAATITPPSTPPTPTITTTPSSNEEALQRLIEAEGRALVNKDLDLIKSIYLSTANRIDGAEKDDNKKKVNAIKWYEKNFNSSTADPEVFTNIYHVNYQFNILGNTAVVYNDSCGTFTQAGVPTPTNFNNVKTDRWTFWRDANGRWWIQEFAFHQPVPDENLKFFFEEKQYECLRWKIRSDENNIPQGKSLIIDQGRARSGNGALRFAFDTKTNLNHSGQIMAEKLPFAGYAHAYIFIPENAPTSLEAGFIAQQIENNSTTYRSVDNYVPLIPGQWTLVTTQATWKPNTVRFLRAGPLFMIGIEIHDKNGAYTGYALIDEINLKTR